MKKWLLSVLFGTALVLGACGGGDDGDNGGTGDTGGNGGADTEESAEDDGGGAVDTAAAEEIFESNCAQCHGADLSGAQGPDLTSVGANYSADEIADIIQNGKGAMPAQNVSDEDTQTLASWLAEKQ
ncbi:cytochrome c551 [Lentibacillus halodurans]|uniref:Cytochrome c551 n=1 Tax=Lentibacillus halodurans TaxID=237679 RepID=A0A1I0WKL0_9BACI|nr:cytochrome c [Lentibacillus halodurans]SFA88476.1 cytochrome c551 [Lentibacillus halodurans]